MNNTFSSSILEQSFEVGVY